MKKLELNQMENLEGGKSWACAIAMAEFTLGTGIVVGGGPLTWVGVAGVGLLWANMVEACAH